MTVTREMVVAEARTWIGVKWRHQGRTREGVDCIGLPQQVGVSLGLLTYDYANYGPEPDPIELIKHLEAAGCYRIDPNDGGDGDLLLFHQGGTMCHYGILTTRVIDEKPYRCVLHSVRQGHRVREEIIQPNAPIVATFRFPGVEA